MAWKLQWRHTASGIRERACVKGRITGDGEPLTGAQVEVRGVSYWGSASTVITGADGTFAVDVMKSELAGEDVDRNRTTGETFQAQVMATNNLGDRFEGQAFDTPTEQGSVGRFTSSCRPAECDCEDLGDIEVDFETPRACEVTLNVSYSGQSVADTDSPLAEGAAMADANVTGTQAGANIWAAQGLCQDTPCNFTTTNADGTATFIVPVVGDAPTLQVSAGLLLGADGIAHTYIGDLVVEACARGETSVEIDVETDHSARDSAPLTSGSPPDTGSQPTTSTTGGLFDLFGSTSTTTGADSTDETEATNSSCDCRTAPGQESPGPWLWTPLMGFGLLVRRRCVKRLLLRSERD